MAMITLLTTGDDAGADDADDDAEDAYDSDTEQHEHCDGKRMNIESA